MHAAFAAFESIQKSAQRGVADTQSAFQQVSAQTSVALSRGVTDGQALLADLAMQVHEQALRSSASVSHASLGLAAEVARYHGDAVRVRAVIGAHVAGLNQLAEQSLKVRGKDFGYAARSVLDALIEEAKEEAADTIQEWIEIQWTVVIM